jgi:hypothetical protein
MDEDKKEYSVTEAAKETGMTSPRIMRRIKNHIIKAKKVGWVWVLPQESIDSLKKEVEEEKSKSQKKD